MLRISLESFIGSMAISVMGFGTLLALRLAAQPESAFLDGLPIAVPFALIIPLIVCAGCIGALLFFMSERHTSLAAVEFGDSLRREAVEFLTSPESDGWREALDGRPEVTAQQVLIQSIREVSMGGREVVRLVGPISMLAISTMALFVLNPLLTLLLVPIGLVAAIAFRSQNGRVEHFNTMFDESALGARQDLLAGFTTTEAGEQTAQLKSGLEEARRADEAIHERMLEPMRMRAIGTAATAAIGGLILVVSVAQTPEAADLDFIRVLLYLIVARLAVSAGVRLGSAVLLISRRETAIERLKQFAANVSSPAKSTNRPGTADVEVTPSPMPLADRVLITLDDSESPLLVLPGDIVLVQTARPASRIGAARLVDVLIDRAQSSEQTNSLKQSTFTESLLPKHEFEQSWPFGPMGHVEIKVPLDVGEESATGSAFFVLARFPHKPWTEALAEAPVAVSAVLALGDDLSLMGGTVKWAGENRSAFVSALGFVPAQHSNVSSRREATTTEVGKQVNAE